MSDFTEKAIKGTFIQLLSEKPLSEITIKELTEACGINRNTFYYHYRDLTALVEEIMIETTDAILAAHPTLRSFEDCLYAILDEKDVPEFNNKLSEFTKIFGFKASSYIVEPAQGVHFV